MVTMSEDEEMRLEESTKAVKLHNIRVYDPEPSAIQCMTFNRTLQLLALSRADNTIEIWALNPTPRLQRQIIPPMSWASVEGLRWGPEGRLFCCGIHGHVIELDLLALGIKQAIPVISGACWCIDVHLDSSRIAAGTEEGYICILDITPEDIQFNKSLDKQEGRVLCVSWTPDGLRLASGSPDAVRVWDLQSGHALHRLETGAGSNKEPCLVWCIQCLDNTTFVSGDSRGRLCMWDLIIGVSIEEHQALANDVLCLTVSPQEDAIYCSGIEPRISMYSKLKTLAGGARTRWSRSHQRCFHTHDVRALACLGVRKLASGGVDTNLMLSSAPPKRLSVMPHLPHKRVSVATSARLVLLSFSRHLELRRVARAEDEAAGGQLLLKLEARSEHSICCAAVSEQANWIAYSTQQQARFFTLEGVDTGTPVLEKVRELPRKLNSFTSLAFSAKEAKRAVAAVLQNILVLELNHQAANVNVSHVISTHSAFTDTVHLVSFSKDRKYLLAADLAGNVSCWTDKKWQKRIELPKRPCEVTAMGMPEGSNELLLIYADHQLLEYNLLTQAYTEFSRNFKPPSKNEVWFNPKLPITNMSFDPDSPRVLFNDATAVYVLNKQLCEIANSTRETVQRLQNLGQYKYIIHSEWLSSSEMLILRVSQSQIDAKLPPSIRTKKLYGSHV